MELLGALRAAGAIVALAWLPGYAWTRAIMPSLRPIERFVTSVALSVAIVTLALIVMSMVFEVPLGGPQAVLAALIIAASGVAVELLQRSGDRRARDRLG